MDKYYRVAPATKHPAFPDKKWEAEYRRKYPCLHHPNWNLPMDIVVQDVGEDVPMSGVDVANVYTCRLDLLEALGPVVDRWLALGNLFDASGKRLENYRTLGSHDRLRMRGGPKSTRQFCSRCGQFLYYPMGDWYLLKSDLTGQPLYFGNDSTALVINQGLHARLQARSWPKVYIHELPILEEPLDCLPADLSQVTRATLNEGNRGRESLG